MSGIGQIAKESTSRLGPGAVLINGLPSMSLVLVIFALITSRLYPWASPLHEGGREIPPGVASVLHTVKDLGTAGGVALAVVVLVVTIMIRPFQVATVQFLEGYWESRVLRPVRTLAVERHARRLSFHQSRRQVEEPDAEDRQFSTVARISRRDQRIEYMRRRAKGITERYPEDIEILLPTGLGNVLRRGEAIAGERYGLDTVVTYPRLYPYLSTRLHQQLTMKLDILDTMAAFTLVFLVESLVSAPLLMRVDWWSLIPVLFSVFSMITYRGALRAAADHSDQLSRAYDLHRFDMLVAMHRKLPENADEEYKDNEALSDFLHGSGPVAEDERTDWTYAHPGGDEVSVRLTGGIPLRRGIIAGHPVRRSRRRRGRG